MSNKTDLKYHLVIVTKWRNKALLGIEDSVKDALRFAEKNSHFKIIDFGVEDGNHVHLVVKISPEFSVSSVVSRLKQLSAEYLWRVEGEELKKHFWSKNRRHLWHGGYYCDSVGKVSEDKILTYVTKNH